MIGAQHLPIRLRNADRRALTEHFLALDADDRRLRFGASLGDDAIRALDERIDFDRDEIFGIAGDDLRLLAVVHVAFYPDKAELGLSVLPTARGLGLGNALFSRAVMHLTNRGVREVFVHCLSQNSAMMHHARKNGMRVVQDGPETDAYLALPPHVQLHLRGVGVGPERALRARRPAQHPDRARPLRGDAAAP